MVLQLQEPDAPGIGVAVLFEAEQVAERGRHIDPDKHRLCVLEDLVVSADADRGQVAVGIVLACVLDGGVDDCVDVAQREVVVEEVVEEFDDAAERTMPDENQTECELADPAFGDGQVEQYRIVGGWWVEGVGKGVSCEVLLPVDELAADVRVLRESGDGLCAGQCVECEALSLFGLECLGR